MQGVRGSNPLGSTRINQTFRFYNEENETIFLSGKIDIFENIVLEKEKISQK